MIEQYLTNIKAFLSQLELYLNHKNDYVKKISKQSLKYLGFDLNENNFSKKYDKSELEDIKKDFNFLDYNLRLIKKIEE